MYVLVRMEKMVLVLTEKKIKCFLGIEAEGPYKGQKVLFIPGTISIERIEKVLKKVESKIDRIYYGAGNDRLISRETLDFLLRQSKPIDVETEEAFFCPPANIILYTRDPKKTEWKYADYIKYVTEKTIIWLDKAGYTFMTSVTDPLFDLDTDIE